MDMAYSNWHWKYVDGRKEMREVDCEPHKYIPDTKITYLSSTFPYPDPQNVGSNSSATPNKKKSDGREV